MKKRGRKNPADLALTTLMPSPNAMYRPDVPYELTDEQGDEWRAVVARMPADWFPRETHAMLAQYCRHVVSARRIAELIAQTEKKKKLDVELYDKLLRAQEREGRALSSLATRMRLSQQATSSADKSKGKARFTLDKPWQSVDGTSTKEN